jgi:hypothetical protein
MAVDAALGWTSGLTADEWSRRYHLDAVERETLKDAHVWPWGRDRELDSALHDARLASAALALSAAS